VHDACAGGVAGGLLDCCAAVHRWWIRVQEGIVGEEKEGVRCFLIAVTELPVTGKQNRVNQRVVLAPLIWITPANRNLPGSSYRGVVRAVLSATWNMSS